MIYGYARCSTNEKMQDINRQVRELKQQGAVDETIYLEFRTDYGQHQGQEQAKRPSAHPLGAVA